MIGIIQPIIPHYRADFFKGLRCEHQIDIFHYKSSSSKSSSHLNLSDIDARKLSCIQFGPVLIYNPFILLNKKYTTIVLMLHFGHISSWLLLFTKFLHKKEIILWGHGISVKRYLKEENSPSFFLKSMIFFADKVWLYTDVQKRMWQNIFPEKEIISLNNTISDVDKILKYGKDISKKELKLAYGIIQEVVFIFCARFETHHRRIDLLEQIINSLDKNRYGFIIIGDGRFKPDFSRMKNVYDFGAVYDRILKDNLFRISDIYLQPGWVGLSVVEGFAYGKPIFTFKRSKEVLQCVEYDYIQHNFNGIIFNTVEDFLNRISTLSDEQINILSQNAQKFASETLQMEQMVQNALKTF